MAHASNGRRVKKKVDSKFLEAPLATLEPEVKVETVLATVSCRNQEGKEQFCTVCYKDADLLIPCEFCPKVYHLKCHAPVINLEEEGEVPEGAAALPQWRCNWCKTKQHVEKEIETVRAPAGNLTEQGNTRQYLLACKFVMDTYKLHGAPVIRWEFPQKYREKFGKVPFNLQYIRERMSPGTPEPFQSIRDMLSAYRQMFDQAALYYRPKKQALKEDPKRYFLEFYSLLQFYYPGCIDMFHGINFIN